MKLNGKVALITGGTSGLGLATAKRFVEEGARVYITGRKQAQIDQAVKEIGGHVTGVQGDVSKLADLDRLYSIIREQVGHLDIIFANAGGGSFAPLGKITEEHYEGIFDSNVKGVIFTVQKALPLLTDGGSVVLNASITASTGPENFSIYSASKAAVRSFARTWSADLKGRKIRVNAISPGVVPTEAYTSLFGGDENAKRYTAEVTAAIPLGRVGEPDEIAKAVTFLASDDSSFITGIDLVVDGGMTQV